MMWILYVVLGLVAVIAVLLVIAVVRAVPKGKLPDKTRKSALKDYSVDYDKHAQKLSRMIQCETISKRNMEDLSKFFVFYDLLEELYPTVFEKVEKKIIEGALLLRWPGKDSARNPILFMSHTDVVEASGFSFDPFGGEIKDGKILGRGSLDTKNQVCAVLSSWEELIAQGFEPPCDVYFETAPDEETFGWRAGAVSDYLKEQGVTLDIVIDEGNSIVTDGLPGVDASLCSIAIMEKGYMDMEFVATSAGGHSSQPMPDSPIARLSKFAAHMDKHSPLKNKISEPVKTYYAAMSDFMPFGERLLFRNLWLFTPLVKRKMMKRKDTRALLNTSFVCTMAEGSKGYNVIPSKATFTANSRIMPFQNMEASVQAIRAVAQKYDLEMNVLVGKDAPIAVKPDNEHYRYLVRMVDEIFPDAVPIPTIVLGCTDARYFPQICDCVVRFGPFRIVKAQQAGVHGVDEYTDIQSLGDGIVFFMHFLKNYS